MSSKAQSLISRADEYNIKMKIVPVEFLSKIKDDISQIAHDNTLNSFQNWIVNEGYVLDIPDLDFTPSSIVIIVWKLKMANVVFHYKGRMVHTNMDDAYMYALEEELTESLFKDEGLKLKDYFWLPLKRLANCSGLVEYGRNNLSYTEDWGSLIRMKAYFSDIEPVNWQWREAKNLDFCSSCGACVKNCPTGALCKEKFIVDTDKCLSFYNESGSKPLPEWIPKTAHCRLVDCMKCQDVCPKNRKNLSNITDTIEFSEEETETILAGWDYNNYSENLREKLKFFYSEYHNIDFIPQNLRALLENPNGLYLSGRESC